MSEPAGPSRNTLGLSKRLLFVAITLGFSLFLVEAALRIYFAIRIGPDVLLYGAAPVEEQAAAGDDAHMRRTLENAGATYSKYAPYQVRRDKNPDTGESFRVTINGRGLRGEDFPDQKPPGTVRVITLGASSTFGYYSPDEGTYPRRLERILNDECERVEHFEVINFGIPHLLAEEILSLLTTEGLPLDPDVVTFYEGINDAGEIIMGTIKGSSPADSESPPEPQPGGLLAALKRITIVRSVYQGARSHSLVLSMIDSMLSSQTQKIEKAVVWQRLEDGIAPYLATLDKLRKITLDHEIEFILANQQAKSESIEREALKGMSYLDEAGIILERLEREGRIGNFEAAFLMHVRLMASFEAWAARNGVPFADIIEATDRDRDVLLSWVHLSQAGNALVARRFADVILERMCL